MLRRQPLLVIEGEAAAEATRRRQRALRALQRARQLLRSESLQRRKRCESARRHFKRESKRWRDSRWSKSATALQRWRKQLRTTLAESAPRQKLLRNESLRRPQQRQNGALPRRRFKCESKRWHKPLQSKSGAELQRRRKQKRTTLAESAPRQKLLRNESLRRLQQRQNGALPRQRFKRESKRWRKPRWSKSGAECSTRHPASSRRRKARRLR